MDVIHERNEMCACDNTIQWYLATLSSISTVKPQPLCGDPEKY